MYGFQLGHEAFVAQILEQMVDGPQRSEKNSERDERYDEWLDPCPNRAIRFDLVHQCFFIRQNVYVLSFLCRRKEIKRGLERLFLPLAGNPASSICAMPGIVGTVRGFDDAM
jgi:hypothetical protein